MLYRATGCIWNLCVGGEESCNRLVEAGAVDPLCKILKKTDDNLELIVNLSVSLSILATNSEEVSEKLRENGTIKLMVKHIGDEDANVRKEIAGTVWNLAHIPENREALVDIGVMQGLNVLLDSEEDETIINTLGALVTIAINARASKEFNELDGLQKLIPFIEEPKKEKICLYSIIALAVLGADIELRDAIREAGALGPLIDLLETKNEAHLEKTCSCLQNLSDNKKKIKLLLDN